MLIPVKSFYLIYTQWNQMARTHLNWFLMLVQRHKLRTTKETNYLTKHLSPEENSIVWLLCIFIVMTVPAGRPLIITYLPVQECCPWY